MSIQTTRFITRKDAEEKAYIKRMEENKNPFLTMPDEQLEDYIEEHFYNFTIVANEWDADYGS